MPEPSILPIVNAAALALAIVGHHALAGTIVAVCGSSSS